MCVCVCDREDGVKFLGSVLEEAAVLEAGVTRRLEDVARAVQVDLGGTRDLSDDATQPPALSLLSLGEGHERVRLLETLSLSLFRGYRGSWKRQEPPDVRARSSLKKVVFDEEEPSARLERATPSASPAASTAAQTASGFVPTGTVRLDIPSAASNGRHSWTRFGASAAITMMRRTPRLSRGCAPSLSLSLSRRRRKAHKLQPPTLFFFEKSECVFGFCVARRGGRSPDEQERTRQDEAQAWVLVEHGTLRVGDPRVQVNR